LFTTGAEPGALLGFLGPRVYEAINGTPFPENVQVAENLFDKGLIDAVVPPSQLSDVVDRALSILVPGTHPRLEPPATLSVTPSDAGAWESIGISRNPKRPDLRQLLAYGAPGMCCPSTAPGRARKTPAFSWHWPASARNPAWSSATPGPGHRSKLRWGRPPS
jgi:hypothetical protein